MNHSNNNCMVELPNTITFVQNLVEGLLTLIIQFLKFFELNRIPIALIAIVANVSQVFLLVIRTIIGTES